MSASVRPYDRSRDCEAVGEFLADVFSPDAAHRNWMQPRWEYMHFHPLIQPDTLRHIGVWEREGRIVALANHEHDFGHVYLQLGPGHDDLKAAMLNYAMEHLAREEDGRRTLSVEIDEADAEWQAIAGELGYVHAGTGEEMSRFDIPATFPPIELPDGFRLIGLDEDDDLMKIDRCMWRGFDHDGEPDDYSPNGRKFMQSAPNFDHTLNIVAVAPDGQFAAYGGIWLDPVGRFGYVEPVCCDPDFRRRGLATACVLEGIRRCAGRGASCAYVGTTKPVYLAMGFKRVWGYGRWRWSSG